MAPGRLWLYKIFLQLVLFSCFALFMYSSYNANLDMTVFREQVQQRLAGLERNQQKEQEERTRLIETLATHWKTEHQDLQGQLDVLRQQTPLEEERKGLEKPPEIGYTKWAKNFYNTRRVEKSEESETKDNDGNDELGLVQMLERELSAEKKGVVDVKTEQSSEDTVTSILAEIEKEQEKEKEKKKEREIEKERHRPALKKPSSSGKCVLGTTLDYKKDFWGGKPMRKCPSSDKKKQYQLSSDGRFLMSDCDGPARVGYGKQSPNVALSASESLDLLLVPKGIEKIDYLRFTCDNGDEAYIVRPTTNETARTRAQSILNKALHKGEKPIYNVVVIMIDALSRAQFIRALPKTLKFFEDINSSPTSKHVVHDFERCGILGAYSPPNRYAFFSGYPFFDDQAFFEGTPFPKSEYKKNRVETRYSDVWMWDILANLGYITFSARDMCSRSANFVYSDFVSRPWTDVHFQDLYCNTGYRGHANSDIHCLQGKYAHEWAFEAAHLFYKHNPDLPRFVMLDFAEGHEPSMTVVRTMDEHLVQFISEYLKDENTFVVVASDHGIGYGKQHVTTAGPVEERLPALYTITPKSLLTGDREQNLLDNTQKVVTSLDVFETIMEVVDNSGKRPWAYSLFNKIPDRYCKEAGISIHACPCQSWDGKQSSRVMWK